MRFYLGTHMPHWLGQVDVPLFVSRRTLCDRKTFPRASCRWVLDSGGFTELNRGGWTITPSQYADEVELYAAEIGVPDWVAPMDWMCEPSVVSNTGLTVAEHQRRTVDNFLTLRERLGTLVVPVVQGWTLDDYLTCLDLYDKAGVNLASEPVVGVGSICRRNADGDIGRILVELSDLHVHAFGVKGQVLTAHSGLLTSADSMAWSYQARHQPPLKGCTHKSCANCLTYALRWRRQLVDRVESWARHLTFNLEGVA